jgi:hypothetical protein
MSPAIVGRALAPAVVVAAALRLARLEPGAGVDALVRRLREGRTLPRPLADPRLYPQVVDALLRWLPPHRCLGRCVKRSLLLLHLWSRCGLAPVLHYGVALGPDGSRRAHAWLSGGPTAPAGGDPGAGFVETLTL